MSDETRVAKQGRSDIVLSERPIQKPAQFETFARLVLGDERVDGIEKHHKNCDLKITAGVKGPTGSPIEKDRLHVLKYMPEPAVAKKKNGEEYQILKRFPHPDFKGLGKITELPGRLIFANLDDSLSLKLKAQKAAGTVNPPGGAPFCSNDGLKPFATRWIAGKWKEVGCNFQTCPYALKKECKPDLGLVYEVTNPVDGRPMSARYESGGFKTLTRFLAFVLTLQKRMREVSNSVYMGIPVRLHLGERTGSDGSVHSRHPVVDITTDGDIFDGIFHTTSRIRKAVESGLAIRELLTARDPGPFPELDAYELAGPGDPPPIATRTIPAVLAQETAKASQPAEVIDGVIEPEEAPQDPPPAREPPKPIIPPGVKQGPDGSVVCNDCACLMGQTSKPGYWVCPDSACRAGVRADGTWTKVPA